MTSRRRHRTAKSRPVLEQLAYHQPINRYPLTEIASAQALDAIHEASMRIVEEIGIEFLNPRAEAILLAAGAERIPHSQRLSLPREMLMAALSHAPSAFTLHARNPAHHVRIGDNALAFCSVASAPHATDLAQGRRSGNRQDYQDFLRLSQSFNIIHMLGGYPVEPIDLPAETRHLDCTLDAITLTDKPYHVYSLARQRNLDVIEMTRIALGLSEAQMRDTPGVFTIVNANSPLRYDAPMLDGIIEMATWGQPVVITPFTLAGAMAPVTIAGALAQQNAEALAGIALTQLVRPGAPVVYGGFTSNVDMRSGAPAFGTPEYMKAMQISGQLARRYGVPFRASNVNASNAPDAQATWESVFSLWATVSGGTNMLMHAAGWLEGGLSASFEKFVIDCDLLQMVASYLNPVPVNDAELGLEAIAEVGPGGHFFGTAHTQERFRDAFHAPILSDWRNFETWRDAGAPMTHEAAHRKYLQVLEQYQAPALEPDKLEALQALVRARSTAKS